MGYRIEYSDPKVRLLEIRNEKKYFITSGNQIISAIKGFETKQAAEDQLDYYRKLKVFVATY